MKPIVEESITAKVRLGSIHTVTMTDSDGNGSLESVSYPVGLGRRGMALIVLDQDDNRLSMWQERYTPIYRAARQVVPTGGVEIYEGLL